MTEYIDLAGLSDLFTPVFPLSASTESGPDRTSAAVSRQVESSGGMARSDRREEPVAFLRSVFDAVPDGIMVVELDGRLSHTNAAGLSALESREPGDVTGRDWVSLWPAESAEVVRCALDAAREGRPARFEVMAQSGRGTPTWWDVSVAPVLENGQVQRLVCVARDVSERKQAEQRAAMLVSESHHRVKNTLATVQAIARLTIRSCESLTIFEDLFNGRLLALANTHDLLIKDGSDTADLRLLLCSELGPYDDATGHRVWLDGPDVTLPTEIAVPFGLVVHELTTNAAKYGAMSVQEGSLAVSWSLRQDADSRCLSLRWTERGGPTVATPTRHGFGSQLLDRVLSGHAQMTASREYAPEGLRVVIEVLLP
ncbi:PAS domain S-box protein [Rubellimicrobium rubrum]|uniref:histidine kinase n=1 Tax=Rubellimicrobium rubrum TaxID=2585369 RepID=A0A5C4MZH8_9RHOB|nr:HWE histidine kinase domain-containing protein [Rubellimicrobium rubrum]TNC49589.1 PAS domain S-box protein [Rubellimicrobium rubrum]